jgi:hypothetical protein
LPSRNPAGEGSSEGRQAGTANIFSLQGYLRGK